jgi:hypothetical protein
VLFDNHYGKGDHAHVDEVEQFYEFRSLDELVEDFEKIVRALGGRI